MVVPVVVAVVCVLVICCVVIIIIIVGVVIVKRRQSSKYIQCTLVLSYDLLYYMYFITYPAMSLPVH